MEEDSKADNRHFGRGRTCKIRQGEAPDELVHVDVEFLTTRRAWCKLLRYADRSIRDFAILRLGEHDNPEDESR
jgi:hypothetical protein